MSQPVFYVDPAQMGDWANEAHARRMAELLTARGWPSQTGSAQDNLFPADEPPPWVWESCLDRVWCEEYQPPLFAYVVTGIVTDNS
jgi:hypothetical protein